MCQFCHLHGEGKKWYLRAENYSEDLLSDMRRRKFIEDFFKNPGDLEASMAMLDNFERLPRFVRAVVTPFVIGRQKKLHYGQVVPLEDITKIFAFVNSVTRLPCICRQVSVGTEQRYCYGVSMVPSEESGMGRIIRSIGADYLTGPETSGLESLSKEEALRQLRELEKKSLCHTVWTFVAPFTAGICNCDRDCMAMKTTVTKNMPVMFRAEFVAGVDPYLCNGCRSCMQACQFGAMSYSAAHEKVAIDPRRCYGCGICRSRCAKDAIVLSDRAAVPAVANLW